MKQKRYYIAMTIKERKRNKEREHKRSEEVKKERNQREGKREGKGREGKNKDNLSIIKNNRNNI
jgi:hypothetical protein